MNLRLSTNDGRTFTLRLRHLLLGFGAVLMLFVGGFVVMAIFDEPDRYDSERIESTDAVLRYDEYVVPRYSRVVMGRPRGSSTSNSRWLRFTDMSTGESLRWSGPKGEADDFDWLTVGACYLHPVDGAAVEEVPCPPSPSTPS